MTTIATTLSAEETYLWLCARSWRSPQTANLGLLPQGNNLREIDWDRLVSLALRNRMQTMLHQIWSASGLVDHVPPRPAQRLKRAAAKYRWQADYLAEAVREYLHHAATINQEVVVIKGLWLSIKIYGSAPMRPGSDIDLLLRRRDIPATLSILENNMGYGTWWRPLLDDAYYDRHHLHQQRCNHNRRIWIEPHWLLDHPYTQLTIDYDALMDRTTPGELFGEPVRELSPPDLLISLAVHLVKHAVYLPEVTHRCDLAQLILADGMLMYFVDVAEAINYYQEKLDWAETVHLARQSGTASILGSVLFVCRRFLGAEIPEAALTTLGFQKIGPAADVPFDSISAPQPKPSLQAVAMSRLADHMLATFRGEKTDPLWEFFLGYNESIVFRPIRLLDLLTYLFPGSGYLDRRYGRSGTVTALLHLLRASTQYIGVGLDTVRYTLRRKVQVRRLDKQGFVWPELPPDPYADER